MKLQPRFICLVVYLFFAFCPRLYGSEVSEPQDSISYVSKLLEGFFLNKKPDWMKPIHGGFSFQDNLEPVFYAEAVYPLYQSKDRADTFFIQPRFNYQDNDEDFYNLGSGYRHYLDTLHALLGINVFGDYQRNHEHGRVGIGAEMLTSQVDLRFNSYIGVTPRRQVESPAAGPVYEKVADGLDMEIGGPLPYIPIAKVYGGGQIYFFEKAKNSYEWHWRLEIKPVTFATANVELFDGNDRQAEWRVDVRMNFDFDKTRFWNRPYSEKPYMLTDARDRSLDRVERENRLVKERYGEGLSFFVAKT